MITPPRHSHARRQSPAMSQFLRQLGALKVKEVPKFLQDKVTVANVTSTPRSSSPSTRPSTSTRDPRALYHVMCVFVTAYITVWPTSTAT